ncbi:Arc family DNA-binding protein [Enterobacter sp.]|uniref:Arc family DNA-binding protein n=1 Tax=Enterobacter sp. TaxID=42895 RepID=UPI002981A453|nr:Arc family DNA-binding protein [Enterobacter sp.]
MSREDPQLRIRLPAELKEKIEQSAKVNNRSMNAEIVTRLNLSYLIDSDKGLLTDLAEPKSFVDALGEHTRSVLEVELPALIDKLSRQVMTDEYQQKLKSLAREQAEKEWEEKNKSRPNP